MDGIERLLERGREERKYVARELIDLRSYIRDNFSVREMKSRDHIIRRIDNCIDKLTE